MLTLMTERFGNLDYAEGSVIEFPAGLPGFEQEKEYILVVLEKMQPLIFLQSRTRPELCFTTIPVTLVDPDYQLYLSAADSKVLGSPEENGSELLCLGILCADEDAAPTVNLLGPVVIDQRGKKGVQAIREDSLYSARHPLFPTERGDEPCL